MKIRIEGKTAPVSLFHSKQVPVPYPSVTNYRFMKLSEYLYCTVTVRRVGKSTVRAHISARVHGKKSGAEHDPNHIFIAI